MEQKIFSKPNCFLGEAPEAICEQEGERGNQVVWRRGGLTLSNRDC